MTEVSLEELAELGPVDYVVVEFPAGATNFTGAMAKELLALVDAGIIRLIDVLILIKDQDGTVEPMELSDVGELGDLQALEAQLAALPLGTLVVGTRRRQAGDVDRRAKQDHDRLIRYLLSM